MEDRLTWPIIEGVSSQGPLFQPKEKGLKVAMQVFKNGRMSWQPVWLELNGHAICVYATEKSPEPAVRFALQECKVNAAVMGLSGKAIDTKQAIIAIVSRFHVDTSTNDSLFFFKCGSKADQEDFLKACLVNHEWAK